jgi:flagellar FliL protein
MSEQQTPNAATPKKSKTMVMALAGVIVIGAGFGGWKFMSWKTAAAAPVEEAEKAAQKKKKQSTVKSTMHLDSFVVNLSGEESAGGYLRVGIDLGLNTEEEAGGEESKKKGAGPTPILRDTVLTALGKAKADELLTPEGKEALKKELLAAFAQRVPELGIIEVFFTEFIVQK